MDIKTKKTLAREFIYGLAFIILNLIFLISLLLSNWYNRYNAIRVGSNLDQEYIEKAGQLSASYKTKQRAQSDFYDHFHPKEEMKISSAKELWSLFRIAAEKDSIEHKWNNVWSPFVSFDLNMMGFSSPSDFKAFILHNSYSKSDVEKVLRANEIITRHDQQIAEYNKFSNRVLSASDVKHYLLISCMTLFLVVFVLRYIFILTKLSLTILRS